MLILCLIVATLAVARLATLVADDVITVGFRRWIVRKFGSTSMPAQLVHCAPWCMSMWFGIIMPVVVLWHTTLTLAILSVPAGSMGAAIILTLLDRKPGE